MAIEVATNVTYVRLYQPGLETQRKGHALASHWSGVVTTQCGARFSAGENQEIQQRNRIPPDWRYCGRCARRISGLYDMV